MNHPRGTFVGRERELGVLHAALERTRSGSGELVLVSGEPGIGKTRLLEEAATRAGTLGFAVAWGRAWELGSAPVYWPFIEVLRTLFERPSGRDEIALCLCRLLPELDPRSAPGAAPRLAQADTFQLCDLVRGYFEAAAAREPVLVVLDDLQAADPSSLGLAEFIARRLGNSRLCLFAGQRDVEARRTPQIEQALSRLGRAGRRLSPAPLELSEVEQLLEAELGRPAPESLQWIHRASEGNPLFVHEFVRLIQARGAAREGGVPSGIRAVIRERLALLEPASVALLQAAAVVGREFDVAIASEVTGVTPAALRDAAEEAQRADLLRDLGSGHLSFSHALVAETLAADQPALVRAQLHLRTAEALERRHAADPSPPLDQIAHHLLRAGDDVRARAIDAAERAAQAACSRLAFADALALAERALEAWACLPVSAPARRIELLILLAEAASRAGERKTAEAASRDAAELAQQLGDGVSFARAALALGAELTVGRRDPELARLLQRALSLLPEGDDPWRAQALARLASARQPEPDPEPPMQLGRAAIRMARRLGDREVLLRVLDSALGALADYAPPEERALLNREAAELAEVHGDRARGLRARLRLVFDHAEAGDLAGFEHELFAYERLADEVRQPRHQAPALLLRSMRAEWEGRFADADQLEREAHELDSQPTEPLAPLRDLGKAIVRDEPARLSRGVERVRAFYPDEAPLIALLVALERARNGDFAHARRLLRELPAPGIPSLLGELHAVGLAAELAWALRDRELAALVEPKLVPSRGRCQVITGIGFCLYGLVDHSLLRLCALLGRGAETERYAATALAAADRLRATPLGAAVRRDLALALSELDAGAHAARSAELLAAASLGFEQVGMAAAAARCRELVPRPSGEGDSSPPATLADAASICCTREGEDWLISGRGELCRVRDGRGMRMLSQLIDSAGRELHVLDLSGALEAVDGGDGGELIDKSARLAYEGRLRDLEREVEEASAWNDAGRRERLEDEGDALRAELARALGLGGRERRSGSATERARVNVRRRLALALRRIDAACPTLGRYLTTHVRTGVYCAYQPPEG